MVPTLKLVLLFWAFFGQVEALSSSSYRTLRYTHVVGQTDWYTCGAAAVATLLTYYYDDPATESEVLEVAVRETEASGKDPREGLTALSLKRYLEGRGYEVRAYRVNLEQLADYFRWGGLPVIGHVTKPQLHFLVIAGLVDPPGGGPAQVLLADSSWGRRIVPIEALVTEKGFSGVILLALPRSAAQMGRVRANQEAELSWALSRLRRLEALGGRWP
ncbi:C39 family peptidase [Thermus scotoductus]|uniref:C39 family peptidase n=1 Tax=Thermus scotoductus TaxID=37636 RepID=UPI001562DEC3|nr:cysteine peptidase family C39 domain-containing protein [Thermus scotoductus]